MKSVSLYGNTWQELSLSVITRLVDGLRRACFAVEIQGAFYDWLAGMGADVSGCTRCEEPSADSSMIVSVGGDGTLLKAAHWGAEAQLPVTGINTGHLGFLTAWQGGDVDVLTEALQQYDFDVECRSMLKAECSALGDDVWPYALNDIALLKENSGSMITVRTHIDGVYLTDYAADGLVVATPSGSTAYNLSAGGPILQPTVPALVLTPVAPHMLTMRPLVVSDTCCIGTCTESRSGSFLLSIDGVTYSLPAGTRVEIHKAEYSLRLARRPRTTFADALRDKLLWGVTGPHQMR